MDSVPTHEKPPVDPEGVLAHLLQDIVSYGERALSAEQLRIRLLEQRARNGATVDDVAAELSLSRADAEALMAGESMVKRRFREYG